MLPASGTENRDDRSATVKAVRNGAVLAENDDTIVVEGNYYFPPDSLKREFFA